MGRDQKGTNSHPSELDERTIIHGCVLDALPLMQAESVHMCATSPPFYGLRLYPGEPSDWPAVRYAPMAGLAEIHIPGCDPECEHEWGEEIAFQTDHKPTGKQATQKGTIDRRENTSGGAWCQKCGGWRGQLGLEPTPEMYVGHLVTVFRLVRRVLRDDGVLFLNLGDSYARNPGRGIKFEGGNNQVKDRQAIEENRGSTVPAGLKEKDLIGIPWRVAFALQADGWWLRSEIVWAKGVSFCSSHAGSVMPESVKDRPTRAHEQVFLLTKKARYFYDHIAVREKARYPDDLRKPYAPGQVDARGNGHDRQGGEVNSTDRAGRNLRSVWTINPEPSSVAHYAGWPSRLVAPMIQAGTSERGVCPACLTPYERVVDYKANYDQREPAHAPNSAPTKVDSTGWRPPDIKTLGWRATCSCEAAEPIPATVLDIFAGTGTTADVARRLGRRSIMIDRSAEYVSMQAERLVQQDLFVSSTR